PFGSLTVETVNCVAAIGAGSLPPSFAGPTSTLLSIVAPFAAEPFTVSLYVMVHVAPAAIVMLPSERLELVEELLGLPQFAKMKLPVSSVTLLLTVLVAETLVACPLPLF